MGAGSTPGAVAAFTTGRSGGKGRFVTQPPPPLPPRRVPYPAVSTNTSSTGGENVYTAEAVHLLSEAQLAADVLLASLASYR